MSNDTTHPTNVISRGNDTNHLKQRTPYKLFGKRILKTGRLVASSHSTSNAVPTRDCDVLVTFPLDTETPTLMWLLDRLRARTPYIIVHVRHHSNTKGSVFHLTATYDGLLQGAEDLGIRKPLKEEFGGGMKDFTVEDHEFFQNVEDESIFLTSQERQIIVHHLLNNLRAYKGEQLGKVKFLEGQAIVPLLESKRIISQVFPLHHQEDLTVLCREWIQKFICPQPLDKIRDYFGVKIAMYFAYLGHYTLALLIPAFIGGIIWFLQGESERFDDQLFLAFALFNAFWATLYLEHWKRRSSELAYNWGTLDSKDELLVDPRSLFFGDLVESPVTGRQVPYYPAWKRNLFRYFVTCPVIFLCLTFTFVLMLLIFELQEWINGKVDREELMNFCTVIPKILLAICIGILDDVYKKIAYWLNNKENYRMEETYENHLIVKVALFQFVNSFLSLFYIAFYLQDMNRLRDQLAAILITRQVIGNIKEAFLPYLYWKARLYKVGYDMVSEMSPTTLEEKHVGGAVDAKKTDQTSSTDDVKEQKSEPQKPEHTLSFTQAEIESAMKKYEDTFEDYLEMFIQFGYVTLFSSAFPLAALCALLNNVVEIRSDAFKLCMNHQRPFGKRAENIGTWQAALELMGVIAVIVNCALIGVFGQIQRMLPIATTAVVVCIIVFLEHIIMALKFLIAYAIPDVPETIATKKARLEFLRREALKKMESQNQTPPPASPMEIREKIMLRQKSRAEASSQILDGKKLPPSAIPVSIAGQNAPKPPPRQIDLTISGNNPFIKELIRQSESPMDIKGVESRSSAMTTSFHTNCYHSGNSYQTTRQVISSSFPPNRTSSSQHHYCTTSSASPDSRTRQQSDLIPNKQNTPSSSQENAKLNVSQKTVRPRSPLMMDKSSSLPIPVPHTDAKHSGDPTSCDLRQRVRLEGNKSPTPV